MLGVSELCTILGHSFVTNFLPFLTTPATGLGLPQSGLQAARPSASYPVQAGDGLRLQLLPVRAPEHGDVGAAEAPLGALLPVLPPVPLPDPLPPGLRDIFQNAGDHGETGGDLPHVSCY